MTLTLDALWDAAPPSNAIFGPGHVEAVPEPARRYLLHAIAEGTPLARAVRLHMHGEIKLGKTWRRFTAEQVLRWDRGMIWRARIRLGPISVQGFDRVVDGRGEMRWKLFGLIPFVSLAGVDITKSTVGRMHVESIWLPSVFAVRETTWLAGDEHSAAAELSSSGIQSRLRLGVKHSGALSDVMTERWGQPGPGEPFQFARFGGFVAAESTFAGFTIPTQLRAGWYYGTDRFSEGEFFRVTIDEAIFK